MTDAAARQAFPDQLRGLALLGIIVVNAPFLAISAEGFTAESVAAPIDWAAAFAVTMLAQGKFFLIFSFLFGYSANFIVKSNQPEERRRYRRRLGGLAVLGVLHAVFLFIGDILLSYAMLGAALMLLFGRSDRAALWTGAISAGVALLWLGFLGLVIALLSPTDLSSDPLFPGLNSALTDGSFLEAAIARAKVLPVTFFLVGALQWGLVFAVFCFGLVAGRRQVFADLGTRAKLWCRLAIFGLAIGLPIQALAAWLSMQGGASFGSTVESFYGLVIGAITAPILSVGYVGILALAAIRFSRILAPLKEPGRTSLSVYIGESIVLSLLFCGYGLGLFGELGAAAVTAIAIFVWVALGIAMHLWLRRFSQGPLERLLGSWTNAPWRHAE